MQEKTECGRASSSTRKKNDMESESMYGILRETKEIERKKDCESTCKNKETEEEKGRKKRDKNEEKETKLTGRCFFCGNPKKLATIIFN